MEGVSTELFQDTLGYLLKTGEDGRSVYDQLCLLVEKLLKDGELETETPEELLQRLGAQQLKYDVHTGDVIADHEVPTAEEEAAREARKLCVRVLRRRAEPASKAGVQPRVQNLVDDVRFFEMAGVGLSLNEARVLQASLRSLACARTLSHCRLFGKVLGVHGNYYIAESSYVPSEDELQPEDPDALKPFELPMVELPAEQPRFGANQFTYWVSAVAGGPWARLPNVTPAQIGAAKCIRKLLTGDLQAEVVSYPPFPGNEAVYLRAQIARIAAATEIAPANYYNIVEQEEEEDEDGNPIQVVPEGPRLEAEPEYEGVEMEELASLDGWVHAKGCLLAKQNRVNVWTKPEKEDDEEGNEEEGQGEDDEDDEEDAEAEEEEDPEEEIPLLTSLAEDAPLYKVRPPREEEGEEEDGEEDVEDEDEEGGIKTRTMPRWHLRQPLKLALGANSPVVLANTRWPGAVAFAADRGHRFGNLYIGFGVPSSLEAFAPGLLGQLQVEGPETAMVKEPLYRDEEKLLTDTLSEDEDPDFE